MSPTLPDEVESRPICKPSRTVIVEAAQAARTTSRHLQEPVHRSLQVDLLGSRISGRRCNKAEEYVGVAVLGAAGSIKCDQRRPVPWCHHQSDDLAFLTAGESSAPGPEDFGK